MIKTERTIIIPLERKHLEPLRKMRNDPSTWHWLTSTNLINEIQQEKWFEKLCLDNSKKYYAIEVNGDFIGIIRTDEWDYTNRSVRIGLDIRPDFRNKGYGTECFKAIIDYLFKQQNMHRLWLLVAKPNQTAIKLYEKLGFKEEGEQQEALYRDGAYWHYIIMSLLEKGESEQDEIPF